MREETAGVRYVCGVGRGSLNLLYKPWHLICNPSDWPGCPWGEMGCPWCSQLAADSQPNSSTCLYKRFFFAMKCIGDSSECALELASLWGKAHSVPHCGEYTVSGGRGEGGLHSARTIRKTSGPLSKDRLQDRRWCQRV